MPKFQYDPVGKRWVKQYETTTPDPLASAKKQRRSHENADAILSPRPADSEDWVQDGHWAYVASGGDKRRNVRAIKYEKQHRHLHIEYHGGRVYTYVGVPPDIARQIYVAPSIGKAIQRLIKGHFSYGRG